MESTSGTGQTQYMGTYVSTMPSSAAPLMDGISSRLPPPAAPFQIPPLQSSFPSLLSPHYDLVKQHCDGWILDVAKPPSVAACHLLIDCVLPRLICRAIPASSSVVRLIHVTQVIAWLTIADDDDDHPGALGADDTTSAQHASRVLSILQYKEDSHGPAINEPTVGSHVSIDDAVCGPNLDSREVLGMTLDLRVAYYASHSKRERKEGALEALTKLWAEMRREMMPSLQDRFVSTMENYFHAVKLQATFRKLHLLPDIEDYLDIRRQASFILPCFVLLEYALGINLDQEAYNNPLVEKFRNLALDFIFLCNDLISCKVEIGVGDYFNLPSIAYSSSANKDWSFQDAIDYVANMIKDVDMQCISLVSVIQQSSSPNLQHPFVNTYIVALGSCMAGSLSWFLETARYRNSST